MVPTRKQIGRKCNRIDGPDTKPSSHRSVSFDEDAKKKKKYTGVKTDFKK